MPAPLISLLHPTRRIGPSEGFPHGWREAHDVWLSRADHPEWIEYVLAVHESRFPDAFASVVEDETVRAWAPFRLVQNFGRDCVVDQLNAAAEASSGSILMGIQDDFFPPQGWDTTVIRAFENGLGTPLDIDGTMGVRESVVLFSSGATPDRDRELMIAGASTRKRYERYGYILDPDFESMFADNHFAWQARRDEAAGLCTIIERLDIQFEHRHPSLTGGPLDAAYLQENRPEAYQAGLLTFRRKQGVKSIAIGLPGNTFSAAWAHGWTALYGHLVTVRNFLTMPIFLYTSNVHCTRMEWASAILESGHQVDYALSIDDDNILTPDQFDMLLADLEADPELDIVVGWCWCDPADVLGDKALVASCGRQKGWDTQRNEKGEGLPGAMFTRADFEASLASGKPAPHLISSKDLFPDAFWSGFPVVLMRREVLEVLGPQAFLPMVRPDVKFGFTSEDASFFYRAHKAGLNSAVDMRVKVPHLKLRAIEQQFLPGVTREQVLDAQGKRFGAAQPEAAALEYTGI